MADEALAFTEAEVLKLTGLSAWKLRHWVRSGVVTPSYGPSFDERGPRLFSFQDVIELRVLAQLRRIRSLQTLRKVGEYLRTISDRPFSTLRIFVTARGGVLFREPSSDRVIHTVGRHQGQVVEEKVVSLEEVSHAVRDALARARKRPKDQVGKIQRRRGVAGGRPVIMGTRIPVWVIKRWHEAGHGIEAIRREYPSLTAADIRAAIDHEDVRGKKTG